MAEKQTDLTHKKVEDTPMEDLTTIKTAEEIKTQLKLAKENQAKETSATTSPESQTTNDMEEVKCNEFETEKDKEESLLQQ